MSSSSPDSVLSLPSGGGAVQGIGETFAPDLFTGTGNLTVPLPLPPGRGALTPRLSLGYSTGQGNSVFGLGWALSVPGVARSTRKRLPRYRDAGPVAERDTFVLSGAEDLVPVGAVADVGTRYRPRTEGLFAEVTRTTAGGADYWRVRTKDGLTSLYGPPPDADELEPRPVTADPEDAGRVFAWHLARTEDPLGNRVAYEYEHDAEPGAPGPATAVYLRRIRYADVHDAASGERRYLVSVTFVYGERPDPFSDFRPGFEIRVRRRCIAVEIRTHAGATPGSYDEGGALVKVVRLRYLDQRIADPEVGEPALDAALLPANGVSLLHSVTVEGHDGAEVEALPPLVFDYSRFEPARRRFRPVTGPLPAAGLADGTLALVDLDGNGLPDLLQLAGGVARVWKNRGGLRFDTPRPLREAPPVGLDHPGVQFLDADGDGRPDLYVHDGTEAGFFPVGFDGRFDRRGFRRYDRAPSLPLGDASARLMDLDGDGVTDLLRTGAAFELFYQRPETGWSDVQRVRRGGAATFPNVDFADPRVRTARLSGAPLADVVLVHDGNVELWPTLGYGRWGARRSMHNAPRFPSGYDPRRVLFGDLDGDGLDDLVYVDDGEVRVWFNRGGGAWSSEFIVRGTPRVTDLADLRIVDLLGNGTAGLLYSRDAARPGAAHYYFLDLTGGQKPYLLTGVDNGLGAVTRITYRPSTHYALADAADPATRWTTPLPFPVQVVAEVVSTDRLSGGRLAQSFAYHHGYWDGHEREFRGFGRVDQRDTETLVTAAPVTTGETAAAGDGALTALPALGALPEAQEEPAGHAAPPTETRTWFHLGPLHDGTGGFTAKDPSGEFWPGDPSALRWGGDELVLHGDREPADPLLALPRPLRRDALRALRGRALRTELYARDGSSRESRPYTVTESVGGVRLVERGDDGETEDGGTPVFFAYALAARTTEWDRGDDPMTSLALTGGHDDFGRPTRQTAVAVPRGRTLYDEAGTGSEPYLVTHATTDYATPAPPAPSAEVPYLHSHAWRTTTYEVAGAPALPFLSPSAEDVDLLAGVLDGTAPRTVIAQTVTRYDGDAFEGRTAGEVGPYGLPSRTETLVLTDGILAAAYAPPTDGDPEPTAIPPYLDPAGQTPWPEAYPQAFRDVLPGLAGYTYHAAAPYATGYFAAVQRARYDVQTPGVDPARGLPLETLDPLGVSTEIVYDAYRLLPAAVTVGGRLTTEAAYDYRALQVRETTDPNGSRTRYAYTPMGLLASVAVMGKDGANEGDTDAAPSTAYTYDLRAFVEGRGPASLTTVRRVFHVNDPDLPTEGADDTITAVEYADGFGRVIQTRTQAEDELFGAAPFYDDAGLPADQTNPGGTAMLDRFEDVVAVSGFTVYDRKGRPVEQYEAYYAAGFGYADDGPQGLKVETFYDARGRAVRVAHPDGGEERTVFGVPDALDTPDAFAPTPWESYAYDRNDNAGRTHPAASAGYSAHWNTPASVLLDALGRVVRRTERLGPAAADEVTLTFAYDVRGNRTRVTDALGRLAHLHVYDLTPVTEERGSNVLRTEHLDAGTSRAVFDAAGGAVEARDAVGALALTARDALGRPDRVWARDAAEEAVTLRQRLVYGDDEERTSAYSLDYAGARGQNLLGRLYRHYDEAGVVITPAYDFKGNPTSTTRRVFRDDVVLAPVAESDGEWAFADWVADWMPAEIPSLSPGIDPEEVARMEMAETVLEERAHASTATFDALGRPRWVAMPENADGAVRTLHPTYTRAGGLKAVALDAEAFVQRIAYDARGQRVLVAYGNGLMTRYAYEPATRRLARVRTERFELAVTPGVEAVGYEPAGGVLQDTAYAYDLAGNVVAQRERAPGSGIAGTVLGVDALDRAFAHDPLYRLVAASGREHTGAHPTPPWGDPAPYGSRTADPTLARAYTRSYTYDRQGNALALQHTATAGSFTRTFELEGTTNRMESLKVGAVKHLYAYDDAGRTVAEDTARRLRWDAAGRLRAFRVQVDTDEPSVYARYLYDAAGERVKKVVRVQEGAGESVTYVGGPKGAFEWHAERERYGDVVRAMSVTHVADDARRLCEVQAGEPPGDDDRPPVRYHLADHLGNSVATVGGADATGVGVIEREEYYAYGGTSFGSHGRKRWRYNAKERDSESGLYAYGARYYAPWALRFVSVDPLYSEYPEYPPYAYAGNRPVSFIDLDGRQPTEPRRGARQETRIPGLSLRQQIPEAFDSLPVLESDELHQIVTAALERLGSPNTDYELRSQNVDVLDLFWEFEWGTGPENSVFLQDSSITQALMDSYRVDVSRRAFYSSREPRIVDGRLTFTPDQLMTGLRNPFTPIPLRLPSGHLTGSVTQSGMDIAEQFVGSFSLDIYPSNMPGILTFVLYDSKSKESLYYRLPVHNRNRQHGDRNYEATTRQVYIWQERINLEYARIYRRD